MKNRRLILATCLMLIFAVMLPGCGAVLPKEHTEEELELINSLNWTLPLSSDYTDIYIVDNAENRFAAVSDEYEASLIDGEGNVIFGPYAGIRTKTVDNIYAVATLSKSSSGQWGYLYENGEWFIEPQFKHAYMFIGNYAAVMDNDDNWVVIDRTGTILSPLDLSDGELIPTDLEGYFIFTKGKYYGVYNVSNDEIVIPADTYTYIRYSGKDNYFVVSLMAPDDIFNNEDDQYSGIYDVDAKELVIQPEKYEHIYYCNGYWSVSWDMIGGISTLSVGMYLNEDFTPAFDSLMFSEMNAFEDGVALVSALPLATPEEIGEKAITEQYYLRSDGSKIEVDNPEAWPRVSFSGGHGVLSDETSFYIINSNGDITGTVSNSYEEGQLGFWYGFKEGSIIIRAYEFIGGVGSYPTFNYNGYGLMNTSGEFILPPMFEYVSQPNNGFVVVEDEILGCGIIKL